MLFKGSGVALVTPFNEDGVDFEKLGELIEYHIENKKPFSTQGMNSLIVDEEKLILERDKYVKRIDEVRKTFDKLSIEIQIMMIELYACGYNHTRVANKHNYARQYLYKIINKEIKKVLKK